MTREEAAQNQARIARDYNLGWWYGVNCKPCCGVFPKFEKFGDTAGGSCLYICEVCGRQTMPFVMPWMAEEAWNAGDTFVEGVQITMEV